MRISSFVGIYIEHKKLDSSAAAAAHLCHILLGLEVKVIKSTNFLRERYGGKLTSRSSISYFSVIHKIPEVGSRVLTKRLKPITNMLM